MMRQILGIIFITSTLLFVTARPVEAQQVVFEDTFSSGLQKWQPTRDDGTMWSIVDGTAEALIDRGSTISELIPKDEYWNTEWKNISFKYEITPLEGADKNTSFGWDDAWHWFEIHFAGGLMNLVRRENTNQPINLFKQFNMVNGTTYQMEIRMIGEKIGIYIDGELLVETTYEGYVSQGGKIGLKAGTGSVYPTRIRYDNVSVTLLSDETQNTDTILNVPLFKQTDPQWKDNEYDHAISWSANPTIGRWGCLVSSIAMVMNYQGITDFPDGTSITPETLNTWLTAQPDGYIGEGLVMWSAVTRLTREISELTGAPKLEYSRVAGDSLQPSIDFIENENPSILQINGHFVTGNGFTANKQDLLIKDPGYSFSLLSEHTTELLSTRLLTPSFTDLSYLYIMHDLNLEITVADENGQPLENIESFTEQLDALDTQESSFIQIQQIAKPETGHFYISVKNNSNEPKKETLAIFAYDDHALFTDLTTETWIANQPQQFEIKYFKTKEEGISTISTVDTFETFRQSLNTLNESNAFYDQATFPLLAGIAQEGTLETDLAQKMVIAQNLVTQIIKSGCWFSLNTYYYLYQQAQSIITKLN